MGGGYNLRFSNRIPPLLYIILKVFERPWWVQNVFTTTLSRDGGLKRSESLQSYKMKRNENLNFFNVQG